tara:strand:+ start:265 stop:921 length:657 start_codon:yes stop_codon:yes gene_type:complete
LIVLSVLLANTLEFQAASQSFNAYAVEAKSIEVKDFSQINPTESVESVSEEIESQAQITYQKIAWVLNIYLVVYAVFFILTMIMKSNSWEPFKKNGFHYYLLIFILIFGVFTTLLYQASHWLDIDLPIIGFFYANNIPIILLPVLIPIFSTFERAFFVCLFLGTLCGMGLIYYNLESHILSLGSSAYAGEILMQCCGVLFLCQVLFVFLFRKLSKSLD